MKCVICKHGETGTGIATVTLERGGATLVFREVPATICDNCGEVYHDEGVTSQLLRRAEEAVQAGVDVGIRRYGTPQISDNDVNSGLHQTWR